MTNPLYREDPRRLRTLIIGSYRKHLPQLFELRHQLELAGITVMSPVGKSSLNPEEEFVLLDEDPIKDPKILQDSIFAKIRSSSFVVVGNFEGYLGTTTLFEMGYSIAYGLSLLTIEAIQDPNLLPYCRLLKDAFPSISINELQNAY